MNRYAKPLPYLLSLLTGLLLLAAAGCGGHDNAPTAGAQPASPTLLAAAPRRPFPQHVTYAPGTIRPNHRAQAQLDDDVRAAYDHWKANYLKAAGSDASGDPLYRVSFGSTDPDRTVSEGQGYGMVILALMAGYETDAQSIFDGLWRFTRAHPSNIDDRLMAWEVPEPGGGADSAFDGDADIAYALLLADAQWGSDGDVNYAAEAHRVIAAIAESTIGPDSRLPLLGDWTAPYGGTYNQYTPRSSDFMPAHFRAYGAFTGDALWDKVVDATQAAVGHIQTDYSPDTGLLPDFMVPLSPTDHTLQPAPPDFLEGPHDGHYHYNAGRVPWRIGTDALVHGDPVSMAQTRKIANWIAATANGQAANIKAGYHLDGTPTGDYFTTFFAAPFGVALMTTPAHQQFLNAIYDAVLDTYEDYYEDSVTLLSLLVMSGNTWTPTSAANHAFTLGFPRLGMWWPDPWEQSLNDIARYDWVILGDWTSEFIAPLKTRNPDIVLLNSTNACELGYNPDGDAGENEEVLAIPPEWFLTQVGTTLAQAVDATTTTFHVNALTATDGAETYALFVPGDTVLIDGESVYVEAVDESAKTLTVQRGYVRPASAHPAGTRVAAHITFWPGTWLLNLSTISPVAVVSSTIGPEIWADYNARVGAALLANPAWDGLLIDRADPNQSWLIGGSTARTIDPDQSNTLLSDYSAFDAAWNAGLRRYESELRQTVGDEKIIFVNWGMENYDLLNGNNYEGFPLDDSDSYRSNWHQTVFGPLPDVGSYFEWLEKGRQPNLTMIETYEDDGAPDATGDGGYDNPCDALDFTPNYRKMRFGLTTALLNDGFYSYEINTNSHGSLCLLWFDEYDNAGQKQGYLGQPLGAAYRVGSSALGQNQLRGGNFESQADLDEWNLETEAGYAAALTLDSTTAAFGTASARIDIAQTQGTDWKISLDTDPVSVISGAEYTLSFWAKADSARDINAWAQQTSGNWDTYLEFGAVTLTTTWQYYEIAVPSSGNDAQAGFSFGLGQDTGSVWLDDVRLQQGNRDIWRRDYEGGIALVNATRLSQTIELSGTFKKINSAQDPAVNNGSLVTQVELPPQDGLILLRQLKERIYLPLIVKR